MAVSGVAMGSASLDADELSELYPRTGWGSLCAATARRHRIDPWAGECLGWFSDGSGSKALATTSHPHPWHR